MTAPRSSPRGLRAGSNLDQIMPVVLFFALFNTVGIVAAVVAATAWSIKAAVGRHREGLKIGWWLPGVTAYLIVRAGVTIATEEEVVDFGISPEAVYFGIGFVTKFIVGVAVGATILVGKPFLAWAVPKVVNIPEVVVGDSRYGTTMANASWIIVVYEVGTAIWDVWLFNNSGFNLFYLARSGTNFVFAFVCITVGLLYVDRRLSQIEGYPGIEHILESSGRIPS